MTFKITKLNFQNLNIVKFMAYRPRIWHENRLFYFYHVPGLKMRKMMGRGLLICVWKVRWWRFVERWGSTEGGRLGQPRLCYRRDFVDRDRSLSWAEWAREKEPGTHTYTKVWGSLARSKNKIQRLLTARGLMQLQEKPLQPETKEISLHPDLKGLFFSETSEADRERH